MSIEVGDRFGRWQVLRATEPRVSPGEDRPRAHHVVRCACGEERVISWRYLRDGTSTGCASKACKQSWIHRRRAVAVAEAVLAAGGTAAQVDAAVRALREVDGRAA